MAVLKCKMCGGKLEIAEGSSIAVCEYCGTEQTIPNVDNEKKLKLFDRANRLRFDCEFDKSSGVYESLVADFPDEAEAYWGLVLCKYGIEYVDDPATGDKIPTCHRSSFESVFDDADYRAVVEKADPVAKSVYETEAARFEEIRKGIIAVSSSEEPYDIFICYKETAENGERTEDSVIAQDVYDKLTEKGYRVFFSRITLEDKLGQEYEPYIFAALNSAKVMLAFGTKEEYYDAVWVKNEWSRFLQIIASGEKRSLIPCYKDIDPYDMPKEFARLQAQDMGKIGAVQDLVRGVEKLIPRQNNQQINGGQQYVQQVIQSGGPNTKALCDRGYLSLEDNAWDKAKECFDQALNIDAKCSDAYGGLFLAEHQTGNWSKYIQSVRKRCEEVEPEQHYMILDDLGVDLTAIRSSYNKAYTGIPEMKELDKTYFVYNTRKDRISYIKSEVQNDKNFLRAKQFKNDASVTRQQNVEEEIEKLFEEYNDRSVQEEESELAKIKNMVSDWYKVESGKIVNKYVKQEEIQKLMSEKEKLENDMNDINIMKDKVESDEESCFSFSNVNWKFERDNWQPIAISVGVAIVSFIFCVFCLGVRDTAKDVFSALFRSLFFGLPMYGISCVVLCWKKSKDDKLGELEYESNARRHRIDKIEGRIKELEKEIDRNGI